MDKTVLFAAKSNGYLWECVPQHLIDTASVMGYLCDSADGWVSPAFVEACKMDTVLFQKTCIFLAATHDIGKFTPAFQKKISYSLQGLADRLMEGGYDLEMEYMETPFYHAFVSGAILHENYGVNETACEVIAAHHGIPRNMGRDYKWCFPFKHHKENVLGKNGEFREVWDITVSKAEQLSGIKVSEIPRLSVMAQILISGLLITADWIASNENYFPLSETWDISKLDDKKRGERGYRSCNVRRGWYPSVYHFSPYIFEDRFAFEANDLQCLAGEIASDGARLMIVEAPMGVGKTEAALMSAEIMATQSGSGGVFIGLPTQATSNAMFPRIVKWGKVVSEELSATINLAHTGARFDEEFRALQVQTSDEDFLTVNHWMTGRHRSLMSDFVDGTMDQALAMALNKKYFMLLHQQLAGKTIIFDEVHSYDAYTDAYLKTTLAYLGQYRCPVILLSATLTNEKKQEFINAYSRDTSAIVSKTNIYPCISWWDGKEYHENPVSKQNLKTNLVDVQWLQGCDLPEKIRGLLSAGGCAGVIRNTIKAAIHTYQLLKNALPEYRLVLLHSRFLMDDRSQLEKRIVELTGKNSSWEKREKLVVVGTQVLEQSLDLDFDVLFTDPCPMDLLLQRLGRVHRHERKRPEGLEETRVFLMKEEDKIVGKNFRPYPSYLIDRTCEMISSNDFKIELPKDIKSLVEQTYDLSQGADGPEKDKYIKTIELGKANANQMRIPEPYNLRSIQGLAQRGLKGLEGNSYDGVRQGNDSISVIILKIKDGKIMDVAESVACGLGCIPDEETSNCFLRQQIRIPIYIVSYDELLRMKGKTGFGEEPVWKYQDMIVLNENCEYVHQAGRIMKKYRYSLEMGLMEEDND